jgi:capsular polysaccharide biosynthesis protein
MCGGDVIPPAGAPRVREYLSYLRNSWLLVVVTTLACAAASWGSWNYSEPEYRSTASVFVRTEGSASPLDAYYGELDMLGLTETYRQLATSSQITAPIIQKLGLIESDKELAARIVIIPGATALMNVTVTGTDREQTTQIAHEVVTNMVTVGNRLAMVAGTSVTLAIVDDASPAERVGAMSTYLMIGTLLGFALAVLAVITRALILDRVQSRRHLERVVNDATVGRTE